MSKLNTYRLKEAIRPAEQKPIIALVNFTVFVSNETSVPSAAVLCPIKPEKLRMGVVVNPIMLTLIPGFPAQSCR